MPGPIDFEALRELAKQLGRPILVTMQRPEPRKQRVADDFVWSLRPTEDIHTTTFVMIKRRDYTPEKPVIFFNVTKNW